MDTEALTRVAVAALEDIKGKEITVLDVRPLTSLFDTLVIASGDSTRQVKALADHVEEKLKEAGAAIIGTEGERAAEWILVDAGDVVIHVMHPAARSHYNLEELWGAVARERAAA
ncbi:MAG: ribosome silencing factor [Thiobacillaceae bacterium]|jgi:ribosome-associated protein|nr:ribosome silencing factor [Thiobacillaceae bacterium]